MADFTSLKENIRGTIVLPLDRPKYDNEIKRLWNACLYKKHPLALVKVKEEGDVVKTIKFCVERKLDICVCCGGTTVLAIVDNAVVIDLSLMCGVTVDENTLTAVIEGGALVSDVDKALHKYGLVTPLGSFSKLGVAGMTLMGGIGFLTKSYGITSDSVLEYDLVSATGDMMKVSAEENEDLFWGMKGTGFNFGVVTAMKFKVYKMPALIVGGTLSYPLSRAKEVIKTIRDYYEQRNDNCLSISMRCFVLPKGPELLIKLHYNGNVNTGQEIVRDLQDLTDPIQNTCKPITHCEFQAQGDDMTPSGRMYCNSTAIFLSELKDEVIDNIINGIENVPGDRTCFTGTYGSIYMISARSNDTRLHGTSSFPFHGNSSCRFFLGMNGSTDIEESLDALKEWMETVVKANTKYRLAPYNGKPQEPVRKLKELKKKYDPDNIFHNNCKNINPKD